MSDLDTSDLAKALQGYELTTAQIYYHLPDHPGLLQEFIWQHYDLAPRYPKLLGFLDFWAHEIEGTLHSVYVARKQLISPTDSRFVDAQFTLQ
jgi:uncharacterized protein Usg